MKGKPTNIQNVSPQPYLEDEFDNFLVLIGNENIENWTIMAEALGVSQKTITRWKKHPRAKEAINKAIAKSIASMEKVGARDWKMHREKLKMLGLIEKIRSEQTGKDGKDLPTPIVQIHNVPGDIGIQENK